MFIDLYNCLSDWNWDNYLSGIAKDLLAIDDITKLEKFYELENGIYSKYVVDDKNVNVTKKCDEILSKWEDVAKRLKDNTKIVISFPKQHIDYTYTWNNEQDCFFETVTMYSQDGKIEGQSQSAYLKNNQYCEKDKEKHDVHEKESCGQKNESHVFKANVFDINEPLPGKGETINPDNYNFVSRYGNISIITVTTNDSSRDAKWNFVNEHNEIMFDDWFDYASDFRNKYCVVGKIVDGEKRYAVVKYSIKHDAIPCVELITGWYDFIDETTVIDGFALVTSSHEYYFVDLENYDECGPFKAACKFYHGFAPVMLSDSLAYSLQKNKWNFIDINGKILCPNYWFDYVGKFEGFYADVIYQGKQYHIDMNGNFIGNNPEDKEDYSKNEENKSSSCVCSDKDNTDSDVHEEDSESLAQQLKTEISNIITDESDERLIFMPKSAESIFKDIINDKLFDIIDNGDGISVRLQQLIKDYPDIPYYKIVERVLGNESLMLDRFCKYVKDDFGFSRAVWNGEVSDSVKKHKHIDDIIFKIYF